MDRPHIEPIFCFTLFSFWRRYFQALSFQAAVRRGGHAHLFDLSREIAFNLSLVYRSSGALDIARMYLYKYITV